MWAEGAHPRGLWAALSWGKGHLLFFEAETSTKDVVLQHEETPDPSRATWANPLPRHPRVLHAPRLQQLRGAGRATSPSSSPFRRCQQTCLQPWPEAWGQHPLPPACPGSSPNFWQGRAFLGMGWPVSPCRLGRETEAGRGVVELWPGTWGRGDQGGDTQVRGPPC